MKKLSFLILICLAFTAKAQMTVVPTPKEFAINSKLPFSETSFYKVSLFVPKDTINQGFLVKVWLTDGRAFYTRTIVCDGNDFLFETGKDQVTYVPYQMIDYITETQK